MYMATDVGNKNTDVLIIDNLWEVASFHLPNWNETISGSIDKNSKLKSRVFYNGPRKYIKKLRKTCMKLKIPFDSKKY